MTAHPAIDARSTRQNPGRGRLRRVGHTVGPPRGFTLTEMLVVILIIVVLSVIALPVVLPAVATRHVDEGTRILQAAIATAQAEAVRSRAPRGIRLLPDTIYNGIPRDNDGDGNVTDVDEQTPLVSNRVIPIETAPDYSSGQFTIDVVPPANLPPLSTPAYWNAALPTTPLLIIESKFIGPLPNTPTGWYWNIRQGDKIRLGESGHIYTVAGPVRRFRVPSNATGALMNSERFINFDLSTIGTGQPGYLGGDTYVSVPLPGPASLYAEFLFLVNRVDDDGDGWVDEGFDGIDNDGDGVTDPGYNGLDDDGDNEVDEIDELRFHLGGPMDGSAGDEYEPERYIMAPGALARLLPVAQGGQGLSAGYTIERRPVPVARAAEIGLPPGVVIDLSSWNAAVPERSRLPVDPLTRTVDIMLDPKGGIVPLTGASPTFASTDAAAGMPYYTFWVTDRDDVFAPFHPIFATASNIPYLLPMPPGSPNYPAANDPFPTRNLKKERRLLSIQVRGGAVATHAVESFNGSLPGLAASTPTTTPGQGG